MSVTDLERGVVARYAATVLGRGEIPMRTLRHLLSWLGDRSDLLNLPLPKPLAKTIANMYGSSFSIADFEKVWATSRGAVIADLQRAGELTPVPQPLFDNIAMLVQALELPPNATAVVQLVACYTRYDQVQYFVQTLAETSGPVPRVLALLTGEPARALEGLISPSGELVASGLIQLGEGSDVAGLGGKLEMPQRVSQCLDRTFDDFAQMRQSLLGAALASGIDASDYEHVAADRDLVCKVLAGAIATRAKGINILLYGPPGTGKTELTKVAAAAADVSLYSTGESVSTGGEADRSARLADLVFSLRLLGTSNRTALLFDEMEDVAWQLMKRGGSKVYLNRLLENNPVPVFWTSNNIHEIDPALLRRMTLAVELRLPPPSQRKRILAKLAERAGLQLEEREVDALARKINATPAVLENALRAAKLANGGAEAVERAALGIVKAVSGVGAHRPKSFPDFVPELVCANLDLIGLAEQLVKSGNLAFSLCLSGPPGTGKSAFARYLARRLGIEVVQKRASDLLSPFVGESEKRIAEAFEEAREAGSFLVFDEADSLLFDRQSAVRSWEITQVNEMLTWMEEHAFPVCFTTNLMDRLDTASLRRFTFHVRYNYLDPAALVRAYRVFFKLERMPADGLALTNLTPGDFAQARKQADVLGIGHDKARIVELLVSISRGKPESQGKIGFVR
jgi:transitional endoplasmic reticulum ATPase